MKLTYLAALLAIASAAQVPFEIPNAKDSFPFGDVNIDSWTFQQTNALQQEWAKNVAKFGKDKHQN